MFDFVFDLKNTYKNTVSFLNVIHTYDKRACLHSNIDNFSHNYNDESKQELMTNMSLGYQIYDN